MIICEGQTLLIFNFTERCDFTPLHIQNARYAGSYEWHVNLQGCKDKTVFDKVLDL